MFEIIYEIQKYPAKNYQICKNHKNTNYNEEKNQSLKTNSEVTQMSELAGKYIKSYYNFILYVQNVNRKVFLKEQNTISGNNN